MKLEQKNITPIESDDGRTYEIITPTEVIRVPSVTTVINNVVHKPALVPWAYKIGVKETHRLLTTEEETFASEGEVRLRLDELERSHTHIMDEGRKRGIAVHSVLEAIATDQEYDFPVKYQPYIAQLRKFIDDYGVEFHESEMKVASLEDGFAGQFDGIITITKHPPRRRHPDMTGKTGLFDAKTNHEGRVYPESHLPQVEGYYKAWRECEGRELDFRLVVGIGENSFQPCFSYASYEVFKAILDTYNAFRNMKSDNPNGRKK
jgi:hypothetical protein